MQVSQDVTSDGTVLLLSGAITFRDHHVFRGMFSGLAAAGCRRCVLDLSRIEFLDSAALGMLLVAEDESKRAGWQLVLRKPTPRIAELLEVAALDSVFKIEW